jgi:hypothetical protein
MSRSTTLERVLGGFPPAIAISLEAVRVARGGTVEPGEGIGALLAGGGGSELPWWSPIAVCLLLLAVAFLYRLRDRSRSGDGGSSEAPAGIPSATEFSGPTDPPGEEPGPEPPGPGGTLHARPAAVFSATVDGGPLPV